MYTVHADTAVHGLAPKRNHPINRGICMHGTPTCDVGQRGRAGGRGHGRGGLSTVSSDTPAPPPS